MSSLGPLLEEATLEVRGHGPPAKEGYSQSSASISPVLMIKQRLRQVLRLELAIAVSTLFQGFACAALQVRALERIFADEDSV